MSPEEDLGHGDIEAALEARRELGARYDAELVDGFAERIERAVERRVDERVALSQRRTAGAEGGKTRQFILGIVSVGVGVPITIVPAVAADSVLPTIIGWLGIVGSTRPTRPPSTGLAAGTTEPAATRRHPSEGVSGVRCALG